MYDTAHRTDGFRLDKQTSEAYGLAFSKMFTKFAIVLNSLQPGSPLLGVLTD